MFTRPIFSLGVLLAAVFVGCRRTPDAAPPPQDPAWFEDVTAQLGIDFVHTAGPAANKHFMPPVIGSGAAVLDFNSCLRCC